MAVRRMSMDGGTEICSCNFCISAFRGGHMPQGARDGGASMPWRIVSMSVRRGEYFPVHLTFASLRPTLSYRPVYHLHNIHNKEGGSLKSINNFFLIKWLSYLQILFNNQLYHFTYLNQSLL